MKKIQLKTLKANSRNLKRFRSRLGHAIMKQREVPRSLDGNKLGLRKRLELSLHPSQKFDTEFRAFKVMAEKLFSQSMVHIDSL